MLLPATHSNFTNTTTPIISPPPCSGKNCNSDFYSRQAVYNGYAISVFFVARICPRLCAALAQSSPSRTHSSTHKAPSPYAANITCRSPFTNLTTCAHAICRPLRILLRRTKRIYHIDHCSRLKT